MKRTSVLFLVVLAQFACVSVWFVPNALIASPASGISFAMSVGWITAMVQLGFIAGTFIYAAGNLADRFPPSIVFFISAVCASAFNLALLYAHEKTGWILGFRFMTGFFIAGIYPVGMKIIADYFDWDFGNALGYLVGALVLGTAFPHWLASGHWQVDWNQVITVTSGLALLGGSMVLFVRKGPFRKTGSRFHPAIMIRVFKDRKFRSSALGYFGHMWELYAFWTFLPFLLQRIIQQKGEFTHLTVSEAAFYVIAIGGPACVLGGFISLRIGSYKVALTALWMSGICCMLSPWILSWSPAVQIIFLLLWGITVIMDSPQFSSLVAQYAPAENRGTAMTIVNCIGFAITVGSILWMGFIKSYVDFRWVFLFLLPGPLFGVWALYSSRRRSSPA